VPLQNVRCPASDQIQIELVKAVLWHVEATSEGIR